VLQAVEQARHVDVIASADLDCLLSIAHQHVRSAVQPAERVVLSDLERPRLEGELD
jgi:hypothetical protein